MREQTVRKRSTTRGNGEMTTRVVPEYGGNGQAVQGEATGFPVGVDIERLYRKTQLLSHATAGVLDRIQDSVPAISWEDELIPIHGLAAEVAVLARDVWLRTDEEARRQMEHTRREQQTILTAATGGGIPEVV